MSLRALLHRATALAVVRLTLALGLGAVALGGTAASAAAAPRTPAYPPTLPCALSVSRTAVAAGAVQLSLVGTGLGARERVDLMLDPSPVRVASFRADENGAFVGRIALSAAQLGAVRRITAASASASCSTRTPSANPPALSGRSTPRSQPGSLPPSGGPVRTPSPSGGPASAPLAGAGTSIDLPVWTVAASIGLLLIGGIAVLLLLGRRR